MESHNYLGIYLRQDRATVVCVASQGRDRKLLACFSVSAEDQAENRMQALAERIAKTCSEKDVTFGQAAVALDCAMFMQHGVHSEFGDYKKIAATVRFDTEEALATDVAEIAVAFRVLSSDDSGSNLEVFTVPRGVLTEILTALQGAGIDPVTVSPDSHCLSCFLQTYAATADTSGHRPMYALLSDARGYLVTVPESSTPSTLRAFPIAAAQNREQLLAREALTTTALAEAAGHVDRLLLFDAKSQVTADVLGKRVGRAVQGCDPVTMAGLRSSDAAACANAVDFTLAYGATLTLPEKDKGINFRSDHMPFQGETLRKNRALKFLSISVTVLLLSVGMLSQGMLIMRNHTRAAFREKLQTDYLAVMKNKTAMPSSIKNAVDELHNHLRRIKIGIGAAGGSQEPVSANLESILKAIESCLEKTGLRVESITVQEESIYMNGSVSSQTNASVVFEAMKQNGLTVGSSGGSPDGNRWKFNVTVNLGKSSKAAQTSERS